MNSKTFKKVKLEPLKDPKRKKTVVLKQPKENQLSSLKYEINHFKKINNTIMNENNQLKEDINSIDNCILEKKEKIEKIKQKLENLKKKKEINGDNQLSDYEIQLALAMEFEKNNGNNNDLLANDPFDCLLCGSEIIGNTHVSFNCEHYYHQGCASDLNNYCPFCN